MKNYILLFASILFFACGDGANSSSSTAGLAADLAGYNVVDFPGTNMQKAMKLDPNSGQIIEEGEVLDGMKTGTWITYHLGGNVTAKSITNYVNGKKNGIYMDIEKNNRVRGYGYYANDKKDGKWITYNFSRRETEEDYKNGELHGFKKTFYKTGKDGQIKEEVEFVNGVQNGVYRYYKEDGTITMDYVYKNGEIVERKKQG